ncbi:MAG TPA: hypothetical protein HPP83_12485 [Candidatus Hydrogenedentes bacterium]|nr:hypothetical protein [Candidatus Hydrogenedentota bacterium]
MILSVLVVNISSNALTLGQIEHVYQQKQEALGTFLLHYRAEENFEKSDGSTSHKQFARQLLTDSVRFRLGKSIEDPSSGTLRPLNIKTYDTETFRALSFDVHGSPNEGSIQAPPTIPHARDQISYNPVALAGLLDSSSYWEPGASGDIPFMTDVSALARDPQARVLEDPVPINVARAYVVEWPDRAPSCYAFLAFCGQESGSSEV